MYFASEKAVQIYNFLVSHQVFGKKIIFLFFGILSLRIIGRNSKFSILARNLDSEQKNSLNNKYLGGLSYETSNHNYGNFI